MARALVSASSQYLTGTTAPFFAGGIYPGGVISIAGWINPTAVNVNLCPWSWCQASDILSENAYFFINTSGVPSIVTTHAGAAAGTSGPALAANVWSHLGAFFNSNIQQGIYVNGGSKATSVNARPCAAMDQLNFGHINGVYMFGGRVAEWGMWNVQLTDEEFAALGRDRISPSLIRPHALLETWALYGDRSPEPGLRGRTPLTPVNNPTRGDHPPIYAPQRPRVGRVFALPPVAPTYISPANGATVIGAAQTLTWAATPAATAYDVHVGLTDPPPLVSGDQTATTYSGTFTPGQTYYWRIVAKNALGSTPGLTWTFTLAAPPPAPFDPFPADGDVRVPGSTSLSWTATGATSYDLDFGTTDPPPRLVNDWAFAYYPRPPVLPGVRFYWRVIAHNAAGTTAGPVWSFVSIPGPVYPTGLQIDAQLGAGFRATLVREPFNAGTWPLGELARQTAHEIGGQQRPGVYVGTGFTSGIPFDTIPDGAMGTRFDGNGYMQAADPGGGGVWNMSLAGGQFDLAIMLKDHIIDPTRRALIAKHDGPRLTGNGFWLATNNGAVEFSLVDQGVVLFRFQRGALTSTGEHLITAYYRAGTAFIAIDGVTQLPVVNISPSAELTALTLAPVRVGHFSDGVAGDGLGQKAVLAYATMAREGDNAFGATLQAQRSWSALAAHARTQPPIEIRTGIQGTGPSDTVASSGSLRWGLDNGYRVTPGYYTPTHPGVRPGWGIGNAIRLSIDFGVERFYAFRGRLVEVTPTPGLKGDRLADCLATDWIDVAAGTPLSALPAQLNQPSHVVVRAVLDQAQGLGPVAVDIHNGSGVWPFAVDEGDGERDALLTELSRVVTSEQGRAVIRGDTVRGGVFTFYGHADHVAVPAIASFDNSMQGLDVTYGLAALFNIIRVEYTPRKVDAATVTLFSLDISQHAEPLAASETRVFEGGYVDPANLAERVGGTQMVPLVAGTDYGLNRNPDGSGENLISNLRVVQTLGGNSYRLEFQNLSDAVPGYLWVAAGIGFQIRGRGIYHYKPVTIERRDNTSVRERGPRRLELTLPYESDGAVATGLAEFLLDLYGTEQPVPNGLTINGNQNAAMMRAALGLQPGDTIAVGEPLTGLDVTHAKFIVQEKRLLLAAPGIVTASFSLAPAPVSLTLRRRLGGQGTAA